MSGVGESSETVDREPTWQVYVYDLLSSATAVVLVGALLFAVSGVWPPMVAIESPSMDPQIEKGDLVFVMDEERFHGDGARESGVVTAHAGAQTGYRSFENPGDVIVFAPNGDERVTPIIHRAMFWVEKGERWYDEADPAAVGGAENCEELPQCPAPHAGFVTKGDNNGLYDPVLGISEIVKPGWVVGTAEVRVPLLGEIRLQTAGAATGADATGHASGRDSAAGNASAPVAPGSGVQTPASPASP